MRAHYTVTVLTLLALVLSGKVGGAAVNFDGTSSTGAFADSAIMTAPPMSVCATVRPSSATTLGEVFAIGRLANNSDRFSLELRGDVSGDPARVFTGIIGTAVSADTTSGYTTGTWHRVCAVWTSDSSRAVYIDGAHVGAETSTTIVPVSVGTTAIGMVRRLSDAGFFNGDITNVGVWNAALDAGELAAYNGGYAAHCIHSSQMPGYYEMVTRDAGGVLPDVSGSTRTPLALQSGTSTATDHPPIIHCQ